MIELLQVQFHYYRAEHEIPHALFDACFFAAGLMPNGLINARHRADLGFLYAHALPWSQEAQSAAVQQRRTLGWRFPWDVMAFQLTAFAETTDPAAAGYCDHLMQHRPLNFIEWHGGQLVNSSCHYMDANTAGAPHFFGRWIAVFETHGAGGQYCIYHGPLYVGDVTRLLAP